MCRSILDVNEEFGTTIALVEHDMSVVMDISDRVVVLDYGRKIADGPPAAVRTDRAVVDAYLGVSSEGATSQARPQGATQARPQGATAPSETSVAPAKPALEGR